MTTQSTKLTFFLQRRVYTENGLMISFIGKICIFPSAEVKCNSHLSLLAKKFLEKTGKCKFMKKQKPLIKMSI